MKKNNKGFTLAELLIVVAIIAVLVAVAIPVFTTQLEKSRDATSVANLRAAYADAMSEYLVSDEAGTTTTIDKDVDIQTGQANSWSGQATNLPFTAPDDPGSITTKTKKTVTFTFTAAADGSVTVTCGALS